MLKKCVEKKISHKIILDKFSQVDDSRDLTTNQKSNNGYNIEVVKSRPYLIL